MNTGYNGTFVISWSQTEVDETPKAMVSSLQVGSNWRWTGSALRVDGPCELLDLEKASNENEPRRRTAYGVHMLVKAAIDPSKPLGTHELDRSRLDMGFELTDGFESYTVSVIFDQTEHGLLAFCGAVPPVNRDLRVVRVNLQPDGSDRLEKQPSGVLNVMAGTRLRTGNSEVFIEDLREGDQLQTRDHGMQSVLWVGKARVARSNLHSDPDNRPICVRAGALGSGLPDADLIVSGTQQILLKGKRAHDMFARNEVLISACDLMDERRVVVENTQHHYDCYYVLLENHEVVWANNLPLESFHPAMGGLHRVGQDGRARLYGLYPHLDYAPMVYEPSVDEACGELISFHAKSA